VNLKLLHNFIVKLEFFGIESTTTSDGDDYFLYGYERKPTTPPRELRLTGSLAEYQLILFGKNFDIHVDVIKSKSTILYDLIEGRNLISIEITPRITINVLCAFTYLLQDKLADEDIQKHAIGLLELAKCYFIEDLISTVEKRLGREVHTWNIPSKIFLGVENNLDIVT
jgi:hypothetical protein